MSGKRQPTKNPYSGPTHHAKSKGKYQQEIKCPRCKKIRVEMVNYKPFRKEHIACGQCRIYFTNDGTGYDRLDNTAGASMRQQTKSHSRHLSGG